MASKSTLIDVRTPGEYSTGHLLDAINIPHESITSQVAQLTGVSKDSDIVLYCRSGRRSGIAKSVLEAVGYKHVVDLGSFEDARRVLEPSQDPE